jgi:hypothetical protein
MMQAPPPATFDAVGWLMGLFAAALVALVGFAVKSIRTVQTKQEASNEKVATAIIALGGRFDRIEHAVFGVTGDKGIYGDVAKIGEFRHKVAGCLQAIGYLLGVEFDDHGRARDTDAPPLIERRLRERRVHAEPVDVEQRRGERRNDRPPTHEGHHE